MPFLVLMVSPCLFLIFGMKIRFFADLILEMFFVPLSSSKIFCIFSCLVVLSFSLMHFLIFLLISRIRSSSCFSVIFLSCMRARLSSSLSLVSCASDASVASAASALFFVMASPFVAAVSAAVAASVTAAFFVAVFCTFSGSASLTSCSRSLYFGSSRGKKLAKLIIFRFQLASLSLIFLKINSWCILA